MVEHPFHDQLSLEEQTEKLGKQAVKLGLIPSFVVHYFPDTWVFYIPNESQSEPLTPEEAYFRLKQLVKQ
ncbi:hypothetical protein [Nostoc sp. 'Lobaria pulmonaria (5183) cyanobiont']|uniref:hypothetical protein n=1 Tax=Nostoc sp. 'Lobaria pulmonaria (5183) cyanobiont' TaxID=1618022 RepID=UPI000CF31A3E|nr:hypothetical protein [Nostoc sp. 'Lobaria pulmonaria (5183) cyanobiont']AVH69280.1 hypothetical protein NLP_0375 [Nostoc sp. 'Lobaria pulmonaria (5183) cyanobiont']